MTTPSSLPRLCTSGEVSQSQLSKGLRRVADNVGDLCLDNPAARTQLEEVVKVCVGEDTEILPGHCMGKGQGACRTPWWGGAGSEAVKGQLHSLRWSWQGWAGG